MPYADTATLRAHLRARYANDPEYRERTLAYRNAWKRNKYATNAEWREQQRTGDKIRRAANVEFVRAIKLERGCTDCGYNAHAEALDFDHVDGDKRGDIASLLWSSQAQLLAEIAKCEVVCANCHRVRTTQRRVD
jgi:hypothetical protein